MNFSIVVPTCNAGDRWQQVIDSILMQSVSPETVYIIDSESTDESFAKAKAANFRVQMIEKSKFDHGGTRQACVNELSSSEIVVFLTHDAVLADKHTIKKLLATFDNPNVGAAYGRQLPRQQANAIEAHARLFNYSTQSQIKKLTDRESLGFKAIFVSNSFAAYRSTALADVGGFPARAILSEDTCVVAKMLLKGWKLAYSAEAQVEHSHNFSYINEFQRYFDVGVFHQRENWIKAEFGGVGGEGQRFVVSEFKYLLEHAPLLIPSSVIRTALKMLAYRLGKIESALPMALKSKLSMNKGFWADEAELLASIESTVTEEGL